MTDRELLEAAARAAGGTLEDWPVYRPDDLTYTKPVLRIGANVFSWNPLLDDGDALRLAVKLHLEPAWLYGEVWVRAKGQDVTIEDQEPDVYAATRRAIVLAAAAMAKDG